MTTRSSGNDADEVTTGAESIAKAYSSGFTPQFGTPSGPSLLASWLRYRRRELAKAADTARPRTPAEREAIAHKAGLKRAGEALQKGDGRDAAFAAGYRRYAKHGGKLGLVGWVKKCAR